jgi:hypothetical protein
VPPYTQGALASGQTLSTLGKAAFNRIRAYAGKQHPDRRTARGLPGRDPPEQALHIIHHILAIQFSLLYPAAPGAWCRNLTPV